jgi:hypothetical protein
MIVVANRLLQHREDSRIHELHAVPARTTVPRVPFLTTTGDEDAGDDNAEADAYDAYDACDGTRSGRLQIHPFIRCVQQRFFIGVFIGATRAGAGAARGALVHVSSGPGGAIVDRLCFVSCDRGVDPSLRPRATKAGILVLLAIVTAVSPRIYSRNVAHAILDNKSWPTAVTGP